MAGKQEFEESDRITSGLPVIRPEMKHDGIHCPERSIIAEVMRRSFHFAMKTAMWFLAFAAALTSARYFLVPPRLLLPAESLALSRHHMWILVHIAGGIVAITVGLFQFCRLASRCVSARAP